MKLISKSSLAFVSLLVLSSCVSLDVMGEFQETGQIFTGTIVPRAGHGTLEIMSTDKSIACSGNYKITHQASMHTWHGAQGLITADCSNGRTLKIDFIHTAEVSGHGKGLDNQGNLVSFFFGPSTEYVGKLYKQEKLQQLVQ